VLVAVAIKVQAGVNNRHTSRMVHRHPDMVACHVVGVMGRVMGMMASLRPHLSLITVTRLRHSTRIRTLCHRLMITVGSQTRIVVVTVMARRHTHNQIVIMVIRPVRSVFRRLK
jgi:hypothetical protein